jgi:2-polyprenyl-3-methyl-5-hydroxy-6-metoxy-1,4-benzoquinol methylase
MEKINLPPEIGNHGEFISDSVEHAFCSTLNNFLVKSLKNKSVLDLGCGSGTYLNNLKEVCPLVKGYDGNPFTLELTNGLGEVADLSQPQSFNLYDWVISFETGEHIPFQFEDNFINNLCNHTKEGIILSWAIEGQPGEGHINCHNNDYIIEKMYNKNFLCDFIQSEYIRDKTPVSWFKTNLLIFYRTNCLIK